ncbi:hypothetical protein JCM11251_005958, partial [Rhodosporidiobolus azoricus]
MNTLQYFLSTLRPAPPPSPRASTSELPIPLPVDRAGDVSPLEVPLPPDDEEIDGVAGGAGEGEGEAGGEGASSLPPPLRRGNSRKGKARAVEDPLRDGETVRTELERGEGVEPAFAGGGEGQLPTPPPTPSLGATSSALVKNGTSLDADIDPEKHPSSLPTISITSPSPSPSPPPSSRSFPLLRTLLSLPLLPLRLLHYPFSGLYLLLRRFLSLFGLAHPARPGWNALLAPAGKAMSTEEGQGGDMEKGGVGTDESENLGGGAGQVLSRRNRILTVALTFSSRSSTKPCPPPLSPSSTPTPPSLTSTPSPSQPSFTIPRPPPPSAPLKLAPKTLVLDLDETLIHSTSRPYKAGRGGAGKGLKTRVVEVVLEGRSTVYTVYKRPWVDFFLRKVSSWYTIIIFTASLPEYADPVIDWLDGGDGRGGMVGGRLFRADCLAHNGSYVKDLAVVDRDLSRVCLVDNSPASYAVNQANGIPIEGWINDPTDECLLDLLPMLDSLRFTNDVRRVLGLRGFGRTGGGGGGGVGGGGGGASGRKTWPYRCCG